MEYKKTTVVSNVAIVSDNDVISFIDNTPKGKISIIITDIIYTKLTVSLMNYIFICQHCGQCCSVCDVQIRDVEVSDIANYLNIKTRSVKRMLGDNNYLKQSPCPFLKNNNCAIYPIRPLVCQFYPFTPIINSDIDKERALIGIIQCNGGKLLIPKLNKISDLVRYIQYDESISNTAKLDIKYLVDTFGILQ